MCQNWTGTLRDEEVGRRSRETAQDKMLKMALNNLINPQTKKAKNGSNQSNQSSNKLIFLTSYAHSQEATHPSNSPKEGLPLIGFRASTPPLGVAPELDSTSHRQLSTHTRFFMSTQTSPRVVNLKSHPAKERKRVRPQDREGKEEASLTSRSGDAALSSATSVADSKRYGTSLFASIAFSH